MHGRGRGGRWVPRLVLAAVLVVSLPWVAAPAGAAVHTAVTRVVVHASPATVRVGSTVVVIGAVSPHASAPVVLERLVGKSWRTVGKARPAADGGFSWSVRASPKPTEWLLRVIRPGSAAARAGVSGLLHVRVVTAAFVVKAVAATPVVAGAQLVVVGSVRPKATGSVQLQRLVGRTWVTLGSARLTSGSAFRFAAVRPAGDYRLRVVKTFTTRIAGGLSPVVTVVVASAPPAVTTAALPAGTVGTAYSATVTASGGTPPYLWTASGLPAGLALSTAGVLSGTPTRVGVSTVTAAVTDSAGRAGTAALVLKVVAPTRAAGRLWAWGYNSDAELGNGTTTSSDVLVPVTGLTSVTEVAGAGSAGYALGSDGTVSAWGSNGVGQLGNNSTTDSRLPIQVTGLTSVTAIAGGAATGYALRSDGTVWAWGDDSYGQLGNNSTAESNLPVQVAGLTSVTAVAAGWFSGYALRSDGTVWAWGGNGVGQLGDGTVPNSSIPVQVSGLTSVTAIAGGADFGYAVRSDGTVWAWGDNGAGQLGSSPVTASGVPVQVGGLTSVTAIAAGNASGYALRADGTVWAWGDNAHGDLGNNSAAASSIPVQVTGLTSVTAIASGVDFGYALRSDGYVSAWGDNASGQLGNGSITDSHVPVQVSGLTSVIDIGSGAASTSGYAIAAG